MLATAPYLTQLSSTGAVTIAADLTSGGASVRPDPGSGIRQKGIGDSGRRRSGPLPCCGLGHLGLRLARA